MIGAADLQGLELFHGLTDAQLAELAAAGEEVRFRRGDVVFRGGEHADSWWVLVDGAIDLLRHVGREDVVVRSMDVPGQWAGGFRAWDEHGVYLATGRGATTGRVLRVPADALRELAQVWFPLAAHLIEGLYSTARSIESTARHRESLVTLGTLAAGLAHEINNPAASATRAVDALEDASATLLASLGRLAADEISARQFSALDALRRQLPGRPLRGDPMALADDEDAVADWLDRHEVVDGWRLAPLLVAGGADPAWCDRVAGEFEGPALGSGLTWVASAASMTALLAEVKEATNRISVLVAAVRSYSQMDRASRQQVDVTEGIESSLVILGHKLGTGVTVVRDYDPAVPPVDAYAGELNQVWANIIDNAVDAMEGTGTLRITTRARPDSVVVEMTDTGPGMSPEVAARVFEAFYTTKDVGKGTGLGLDIARRIVEERHGGTIAVEPGAVEPGAVEPGAAGTTLRVEIPLRGSTS